MNSLWLMQKELKGLTWSSFWHHTEACLMWVLSLLSIPFFFLSLFGELWMNLNEFDIWRWCRAKTEAILNPSLFRPRCLTSVTGKSILLSSTSQILRVLERSRIILLRHLFSSFHSYWVIYSKSIYRDVYFKNLLCVLVNSLFCNCFLA